MQLEEKISQAAARFELCALLDLLRSMGYGDSEIELRSNQTTLHQAAEISAVRFELTPRRRVLITVNLGWLAPQSALPTYFLRFLSQQHEESLSEYLNFFCHHLLRASADGSFPERDERRFRSWPESRKQLRSLLGQRSLSTIHWVFRGIYPELEVAVKRTVLQRSVRTRGMVLGSWAIGDGASCGGVSQVPVSGIEVTLFSDEALSTLSKPWAREAGVRLRAEVFPTLSAYGLFLHVVLVIRDQQSFMILQKNQYLGYEPIAEGPARERPGEKLARSIVLWSGEVPRRTE